MNAREMIEQEMREAWESTGHTGNMIAAERVIERLLIDLQNTENNRKRIEEDFYAYAEKNLQLKQRVEELEKRIWAEDQKKEPGDEMATASGISMLLRDNERYQRERYRDRLDLMVAAMYFAEQESHSKSAYMWEPEYLVKLAVKYLAAIDAEVEK